MRCCNTSICFSVALEKESVSVTNFCRDFVVVCQNLRIKMVSQCNESFVRVITLLKLVAGQDELQLTCNLFVVKFLAVQ